MVLMAPVRTSGGGPPPPTIKRTNQQQHTESLRCPRRGQDGTEQATETGEGEGDEYEAKHHNRNRVWAWGWPSRVIRGVGGDCRSG
jgi:hypothetical protein